MNYTIKNNTNKNMSTLHNMVNRYFPYAQKEMGFNMPVTIVFESDLENSKKALGKTAYYSPSDYTVVLYTDNRHPKDVMKSLSHELVHHKQNCNGELEGITGEQGYAQTEHGQRIEEEAYSLGNTCFRNWEDSMKKQINETTYSKGRSLNMINEDTLRKSIREAILKSGLLEGANKIFAPNHYCVHHGGINHNGKVEMAEAVDHNYDETIARVTHYDMKLSDGTILENIPLEDIQVTEASLAEHHPGHAAKRDDDPKEKKKKVKEEEGEEEGEEELDERRKTKDRAQGRDAGGRRVKDLSGEKLNEDEKLEEQDWWEETDPKSWDSPEKTPCPEGQVRGLDGVCYDEEEEEPIKEWYDSSLFKRLLQESIRRK